MTADKVRSNYPSPNEQVRVTDPLAEKPIIVTNPDVQQVATNNGIAGSLASGWKPDVQIGPSPPGIANDVNPLIARAGARRRMGAR